MHVADVHDDIHALGDAPKHRVFVVQPRRRHDGDEELRPVCVGSAVGHGHRVGPVVAQRRVELVLQSDVNVKNRKQTQANKETEI